MRTRLAIRVAVVLAVARLSWAGFSGTDVYLPLVGSATGGSRWRTTVWVYNAEDLPADVTFYLLPRQANPAPASYSDTIRPGEVKRYDDAVELMFHESTFGALRIVADRRLLVASRLSTRTPTGTDRDSKGQFAGGIPASFAIGTGERTQIVGVRQTSPHRNVADVHFDVGVVETTGNPCTLTLRLLDETGTQVADPVSWEIGAREQRQENLWSVFGTGVTNGRIELEVSGGAGRVIAFGVSVANGSDDPWAVEMHYPDRLVTEAGSSPGEGGTAGTDDTGRRIAGAPTLAVGGGGSDLAAAARRQAGSGAITARSAGGVGVYGENSATGSSGALGTNDGYGVWGQGSAAGVAGSSSTGRGVEGASTNGDGVYGHSSTGRGVYGESQGNVGVYGKNVASGNHGELGSFLFGALGQHNNTMNYGALGTDTAGVVGRSSTGRGVDGASTSGDGVCGQSSTGRGVYGENSATGSSGALGTNDGYGVWGQGSAAGVVGSSSTGRGVEGASTTGYGVYGHSVSQVGVYGQSSTSYGVWGASNGDVGVFGTSSTYGVYGINNNNNFGYLGSADYGAGGSSVNGYGVYGRSEASDGVYGLNHSTNNYGLLGGPDHGVYGFHSGGGNAGSLGTATAGVAGSSSTGRGVEGASTNGYGVYGHSSTGRGVYGESQSDIGVYGKNVASGNYGYLGGGGYGVLGTGSTAGVYGGHSSSGNFGYLGSADYGVYGSSSGGHAGYFKGNVHVHGTLSKSSGSFKIDHPLDPEHKYLYHSFVESPDMKNVYDGVVMTDEDGYAEVVLPDWFEALNRDFRYQLTVIDDSDRFVLAKVVKKIADHRFAIRTNYGNVEVCWQVTGIRKDPFAEAHRIPVEEIKPPNKQGTYLHPKEWGQPEERGEDFATGRSTP